MGGSGSTIEEILDLEKLKRGTDTSIPLLNESC